MIRRRAFGLRPRLLAALVFTSVVTLGGRRVGPPAAAAAAPDRPGGERPQGRDEPTDVQFFPPAIASSLKSTLKRAEPEERLAQLERSDLAAAPSRCATRTGARVIVAELDSRRAPTSTPTSAARSSRAARSSTRSSPAERDGAQRRPGHRPSSRSTCQRRLAQAGTATRPATDFVLVTLKPLTDVTTAVGQVRNAFVAAAAAACSSRSCSASASPPASAGASRACAPPRCAWRRKGPTPRPRATTASTRSATWPGRWPPCSASCAVRRPRGAPSWRRRRTSCARR